MDKIESKIFKSAEEGSKYVANEIIKLIQKNNKKSKKTILGLATGASPINLYFELIKMHQELKVSFNNVITFNLDEYYPMDPTAAQSYHRFMHVNFFNHVDILPENIYIPDGTVDIEDVQDYCSNYEKLIEDCGGIDIQILGIGRTGHIGFNEPGSSPKSKTRLVTLDKKTRTDAAKDFISEDNVPRRAITMGVGTIAKAEKIFLFAWGEKKAAIVKKAIEGDRNWNVPATFLQEHPNTEFIMDETASSNLTRVQTPWLVGSCIWDSKLTHKAVTWLSLKLNKPVLKLTDEDYNAYGMGDLVAQTGSAYELNLTAFRALRDTITGWPGGKPGTEGQNRPERAKPFPKRSLVFSPQPDDDMVSMGGTIIRLVDQGHDVHVAYQTSGNNVVNDDDVVNQINILEEFSKTFQLDEAKTQGVAANLKKFIQTKQNNTGELDNVKRIKTLIRKIEAKSACRYCGVREKNVHFLNLPFYENQELKKEHFTAEDLQIVKNILSTVQPHQIFAAGDLTDPQGTHKICFDLIILALNELKNESWTNDCWVWLYKGESQEWSVDEIQMAVPLSPDEAIKKKQAILKHQSHKDNLIFTGDDHREIWKRSDDKDKKTAQTYNILGLPEYEAIESFRKHEWKVN